jgi:hypothetical protein
VKIWKHMSDKLLTDIGTHSYLFRLRQLLVEHKCVIQTEIEFQNLDCPWTKLLRTLLPVEERKNVHSSQITARKLWVGLSKWKAVMLFTGHNSDFIISFLTSNWKCAYLLPLAKFKMSHCTLWKWGNFRLVPSLNSFSLHMWILWSWNFWLGLRRCVFSMSRQDFGRIYSSEDILAVENALSCISADRTNEGKVICFHST